MARHAGGGDAKKTGRKAGRKSTPAPADPDARGAPAPPVYARPQIAALPVFADEDGRRWVLLITSRETRRWVIPKGWPMKGRKDYDAAAQEALEEAGVVGHVHKTRFGAYRYWKRQADAFELCEVGVYLLEVDGQLETWREKGQREARWFGISDAAALVDEPELGDIIRRLAE